MEILLASYYQNKSDVIRNQLIESYMPFIVKQVSLNIGRYVQSENDDALIVGMEAFDEALNKNMTQIRAHLLISLSSSKAELVILCAVIEKSPQENSLSLQKSLIKSLWKTKVWKMKVTLKTLKMILINLRYI